MIIECKKSASINNKTLVRFLNTSNQNKNLMNLPIPKHNKYILLIVLLSFSLNKMVIWGINAMASV
jgi:hypothetical protein